MRELYNEDDLRLMKMTRKSISRSRIQEIIEFCREAQIQRIGIANCASMQKYADVVIDILTNAGFDVFSINCRNSKLYNAELYNDNSEGLSCNPVSQAKFLNDNYTNLNINIGLCMGHGLIFNKHSNAPVTTLIVKDFSADHKTIDSLHAE